MRLLGRNRSLDLGTAALPLCVVFMVSALFFWTSGCAHQTSVSDPTLTKLWAGYPVSDEVLQTAKTKWVNDKTLLDMQEGLSILRRGDLTPDEMKRAEGYLTSAYNTFEDLKDPENFSKAFTPDSQTPYRGRPYERMLTAMLLGLMDASQKRCDIALPAFRAAEFLDARWQAYMYGSDAPMIYAMTLRCQLEAHASESDLHRTREGLQKALRLQLLLDPLLDAIAQYSGSAPKTPETQIALTLLEVGLPSALLVAPADAGVEQILSNASAESMRFLSRALKDKEEPYYSAINPKLKKLGPQTTLVEQAFRPIEQSVVSRAHLSDKLQESVSLTREIEANLKLPVAAVYFDGYGPEVKQEGQYKEIAKIVPVLPSYATPGVPERMISTQAPCGVSNPNGNLIFALCRNSVSGLVVDGEYPALKLWASSFQATTMAGRRFDKILKGRAQFRMGTEVAALIGAYTALALMDAGLRSRDSNLQAAGAIVGAVALGAFLAGRATNPEADIRQVTKNLESGYLLLLKK